MPEPAPILILGAGVIGLTTAVRLLESKYKHHPVHILADNLPGDPLNAQYASQIAGAHHLSFADDGDARQRRWDLRTFQVLYDEWLARGEETGLMALTQTELWVGSNTHLKIYEQHPDFRLLDPKTAPCKADHMISFTSLTITPALYLSALVQRVKTLGGHIHRAATPSVEDLVTPRLSRLYSKTNTKPRAIFICTGLGARDLGGVTDKKVYPTRGQVVRVRAPWVRSGTTRQVGSLAGGEGGERTYVIPRCTGEVILGGTREENDWEEQPREATTADILRRAVEICPQLIPPHVRAGTAVPDAPRSDVRALCNATGVSFAPGNTANAIGGEVAGPPPSSARVPDASGLEGIVVDSIVGFRPSREGGARLEREEMQLLGEAVTVIHNYGHGGAGWQSSWGCAEDAVALLSDAKL